MDEKSLQNIVGGRAPFLNNKDNIDKGIAQDILNDISSVYSNLDMALELAVKNNKNYIILKFKDTDGNICNGAYHLESESFEKSLCSLLNKIEDGNVAIKFLNERLKKRQYEHGELLNISYKWGIGKQCSICDWDYNSIKIKVNDLALGNLIKMVANNNLNELNGLVNNLKWSGNIIQLVKDFNNFSLHRTIGATFGNIDIEKCLTENMLTTTDVLGIIRKQTNVSGKQKFKSIFVVKELGKFVVILIWNVDYTRKNIETTILGEKALDIENDRFISDHNIFSRIESRASLPSEVIDSIFANIG